MNRRSFLQAITALVAGSTITADLPAVAADEQADVEFAYGPTWLAAMKDALGIDGDVEHIRLTFYTGRQAHAFVIWQVGKAEIISLPAQGIKPVREALGLPYLAQVLEIEIPNEGFVTFHYQFAPGYMPVGKAIGLMNGVEGAT